MEALLTLAEDAAVIGYVLPDVASIELGSTRSIVNIVEGIRLKRGTYVTLGGDPLEFFVGEVIDGPYYVDEGEGLKTRYVVDLSASVRGGVPAVVLTRPLPGTPVKVMDPRAVQAFIGAVGDMRLGRLPTQEEVEVGLDTSTMTRHLGIFGTTGSGKSNTIQVVVEEASRNGFSILIFDVEGEYVFMDKPTDRLLELLRSFGEKPEGLGNLKVYVPAPSTSRRRDAARFSISFQEADKDLFSEVAGLTRMEQLYFLDLIEKVEQVAPAFRRVSLDAVIERLKKRLEAQADNPTMPEFIAEAHTSLYSKLMLIKHLGLVDVDVPVLKPEELLKAGQATVVDFSDADDYVRNLVIANLLDAIFKYKMENIETPNLLIVIEEAHTFISRYKRDRMLATLMMLVELARRGRKRGICLGFVTQQPAHLPSEILELCNTRIIHRMSSTANIHVLKESTGNVPDPLWDMLPSLGRGEALVSSPRYTRAVTVKVRPVKSMRIAIE
ncbi:MAG: ATP-binding protein [Candidatus Bathyarchaeia archaeon]